MLGNTIRDTSFCDAISNIYDEMVLTIFINTIATSQVKRCRVMFNPTNNLPFYMGFCDGVDKKYQH